MSPRGAGVGFAKVTVYCTDGAVVPCDPSNGTDTQDLLLTANTSDVLCAVGGVTGCTAAGADYSGKLAYTFALRITDHANGSPAAECTISGGIPPCVSATVQDAVFSVPANCTQNSVVSGSTCQVTTTADTLAPGTVREFQRAVVAIKSIRGLDMGPDGSLGAGCPLSCGTGDESEYVSQSLYTP